MPYSVWLNFTAHVGFAMRADLSPISTLLNGSALELSRTGNLLAMLAKEE